MTLRILLEGRAAGAANMARDTELATALASGPSSLPASGEPVIRLYGWEPPAVSLGYHQDAEDVDAAALAREGIDLVRRPTGGRAILHWNEVTYCAAVPLALGSPRQIYAMLNAALLDGIRAMGIAAGLAADDDDLRMAASSAAGVPCFSTSVRSEIRAGGRKLVGSAQRRFGDVVLQHGSFLLGPEHRALARFVRARRGEEPGAPAAAIAAGLGARTTDAAAELRRGVGFVEAAGALASGFERYFSCVSAAPAVIAEAPPTFHHQVQP